MRLNRLALVLLLVASPALAGVMYDDQGAFIIGPNGQFAPSKCVQPSTAANTTAHYNQVQIYKTCVEAEAQNDMATTQHNMDNSLQIIETDTPTSQNGRDVIQRQTRSAAQRLGADH